MFELPSTDPPPDRGFLETLAIDMNDRGDAIGFVRIFDFEDFVEKNVLWSFGGRSGDPREALEDLIDAVERLAAAGEISEARALSLLAKLDTALAALDAEVPAAPVRALGAFIREVEALKTAGLLSGDSADALVLAAEEIIGLLP